MLSADEEIGQVLALKRGSMSQQALAAAMRSRGWKWSQATVWSVEKGDRPLRLSESVDVAAVLGIDVQELLTDPVLAGYNKELLEALEGRNRAAKEIASAVARFQESDHRLEQLLNEADARGIDTAEAWISAATPGPSTVEEAVEWGRAMFENAHQLEEEHSDGEHPEEA